MNVILDRAISGKVGSLVVFKDPQSLDDPVQKETVSGMIERYGTGPFEVRSEPRKGFVVLMWTEEHHLGDNKPGEIVHFAGSLANLALDSSYIELYGG